MIVTELGHVSMQIPTEPIPQSRQQRRLDAIVQILADLGILGQTLKQPRHDLHAAEAHGLLGRLAVRQKVPGVEAFDGR